MRTVTVINKKHVALRKAARVKEERMTPALSPEYDDHMEIKRYGENVINYDLKS